MRLFLVCAALALLSWTPASGQTPGQLTIIAPAAPGGGWDQLAREMERELEATGLTSSVQVENVPGAAGTIGLAQFVNTRRGDGDALLVNGLVMLGAILWNESPVSLDMVTPIARLTGEYEVVAVPAGSPHTDMASLVRALRENPSAVSWGGGSAGGTDHILAGLIVAAADLDPQRANYIAFSGGGEAVTALLGGQVTAGISGYSEFAQHIASGRLRAIAISAPDRVAGLNVPTLREQGLDVMLENWRAVMAPPGLRPAEQEALRSLVERMSRSPSWQATLARLGWSDSYLDGPAFESFLDDERVRVARVVSRLRSPAGGGAGVVGEWAFPALVFLGAAAVALTLFLRRPDPTSSAKTPASASALAWLTAGLLAFAAFLHLAGFVAAGTALFTCTSSAFGSRRWMRDALVGLALCTAVYLLFVRGLGVSLPAGLAAELALNALAALASGFAVALTPHNLLWALAGVTLGTAVGVLPGIGPALTVALLLPVTYSLDPTAAFIMFAGIYYGGMYGGSTTSILLNTPGESASAMSAVEGHLMARAGRGSAALATAAIGSFVAGTLGTAALTFCAPLMVNVALAFGPAEYFALAVLAFVAVCAALGESRLLGFASLLFGLLLGVIGIDPLTGVPRLTLGIPQLMDGIDVVIVVIGLFAVGEVLHAAASPESGAETIPFRGSPWMTRDEWARSWKPWLRGAAIGFPLGALPAGGAEIPTFLSYAAEKRLARDPSAFGKGAIEGVAGPEAANNAAAAGVLVPLLALGLPTSATAAVLLAAFQRYGLQPGPLLFEHEPTLVWGLIASLYVGNLMLLVLNLPLVGVWTRLLSIPRPALNGGILVLASAGAYSVNRSLFDVGVLFGIGALGYWMRRTSIPLAPAIIGLILGPMAEQQLRRALAIAGGSPSALFTRPISATLLLAAILLLCAPLVARIWRGRVGRSEPHEPTAPT